MTTTTNTCCGRSYAGYKFGRSGTCGKKAKFERDGKWYCGIHDPVAVSSRVKALDDKWIADRERLGAQENARKEVERRAGVS